MAGIKEIRTRIDSVQQTLKITNAMYLISSSKMRKARQQLNNVQPYFLKISSTIADILHHSPEIEHIYFDKRPEVKRRKAGYIVITGDKGLAGAYNQNAIRQAQQLLTAQGNAALYVVGEYGRRWFSQRGIAIEESFHYTAQNPTLDRARHIAELLLERFDAGEISAVWVIYTDMKNGLEAVVRQERILPMHREHFHAAAAAAAGDKAYEFVPSAGAVLDNAARSCLTGYIYSSLVDSFCSEQSARMTAMNAADQNAEELLKDLSVQYNRARQAAITQEITEVSAGERAQRSKKEKEG